MNGAAVLLRFDTEDFLTPESDDALLFLAKALSHRSIRATFPLTTWKVRSLIQRGRRDVIEALRPHDLGFHSTSHSVHPTIAEELATAPDRQAVRAFERREEDGLKEVEAALDRPVVCYTQPGGNWVAEACTALRKWGVPLQYSESWNAYVDVGGSPFWMGGVLQWSGHVACPKPFLSALPDALKEASREVEEALGLSANGPSGLVNIVAHPTELVTEVFWDAWNFRGGVNREEPLWEAPPRRPKDVVHEAMAAFETYIDRIRSLPGVAFWSASDLVRLFPDRAQEAVFDIEDARRVAEASVGGRIGSVALRSALLSPGEAVTLVALAIVAIEVGETNRPLAMPEILPSFDEEALSGPARIPLTTLKRAARRLAEGGELPANVDGFGLTDIAEGLSKLLLTRVTEGSWPDEISVGGGEILTRRFVKPEEDLHWDWPIFPPAFRAPSLRNRALRAVWTLKPTSTSFCDHVLG